MRRFVRSVLIAALGMPALLSAQGFAVNELGTCAMGRAGTAAAGPCRDGSGIWANPASLAGLSGTHVSASGTLIMPAGGFTDDLFGVKTDMPSQRYLVPSVYLTHQTGKLGFGVGVFAPYGLGTKWCTGDPCAPLDFIGRFDSYNTQIRSIYVQPTLAYQVNDWLSLGLGVAYIHSTLELHQRVDLSLQNLPANPLFAGTFAAIGIPSFTDFADASLNGSGNGVAFNGGILVKVSDRLTLGGHFITRKTITYSGDATIAQVPTNLVFATGTTPLNPSTPLPIDAAVAAQFVAGGPLSSQPVSTAIVMPDQGTVGFAFKASDKWTVMGDYQQIVWGWLQAITIDFSNLPPNNDPVLPEGFKDSHAIRIGTQYQVSAETTIRAGYLHHTPAAPAQTVTPLLPEGARNEFTIGLGMDIAQGLRFDAAYQLIIQQDRRGRAGTTFNNGLYTFGANLFGAGLSYTF